MALAPPRARFHPCATTRVRATKRATALAPHHDLWLARSAPGFPGSAHNAQKRGIRALWCLVPHVGAAPLDRLRFDRGLCARGVLYKASPPSARFFRLPCGPRAYFLPWLVGTILSLTFDARSSSSSSRNYSNNSNKSNIDNDNNNNTDNNHHAATSITTKTTEATTQSTTRYCHSWC